MLEFILMIKLEMKPSPKLVKQIAAIERFCGYWDRGTSASHGLLREIEENSIFAGCIASLNLDSSTPTKSMVSLSKITNPEKSNIDINCLKQILIQHESLIELELYDIVALFNKTNSNEILDYKQFLRKSPLNFTAPTLDKEEIVFPAVSSFLVETRLEELLEWTKCELLENNFHPLFIIGTFYLLFLQISPFPTANHRLAIVLLFQLLDSHGYSFIRYSHFAEIFEQRSKQYFLALRQAEKTAGNSWSSLNIWLEFFLDALIDCSEKLLDQAEKSLGITRLSEIQKRIVDVVKTNGSASRERIVNETGIKLSTVKYNLGILADKGHLKRDGQGRATSYSLV